MAVLATWAGQQQSEWLDRLTWHRELCMDDVVGKCIHVGFLDNRGGCDRKEVRMNIPYQYTGTKQFVSYPTVPGEATHPGGASWVGNEVRPSDMRYDYLAEVMVGNDI
jgi:hypothetical protein